MVFFLLEEDLNIEYDVVSLCTLFLTERSSHSKWVISPCMLKMNFKFC